MSQSEVKLSRSETVPWHGDWQPTVSQEQRDQAKALFDEMMAHYPPDHLRHIIDHVCESIGTVLEQGGCRRGHLDETGPLFDFAFTRGNRPRYLTAEFLGGGRGLYLNFTNTAPDGRTHA